MTAPLPLLNAFVDDDEKTIILIEQTPEGFRERRIAARYTTYHRRGDIKPDLMRSFKNSDRVVSVQASESWVRVSWTNDRTRRDARHQLRAHGIESYEGDVDPVRWHLIETRTPIAKPRRCYLDIETDSRVSFSKKEEMRILCWTISNDDGPVARGLLDEDTDEDETRLLSEMWIVLKDYDQVNAWYGGDPDDKTKGFDFYVIAARTRRCGLTVDTRRWLWLDQLVVWARMNSAESGDEKESMRLEDIAQSQIKEGKEVTPSWVIERFGNKTLGALAWDLWEAGGKFRQLLIDYCSKDTELLRKIEKRKGFLSLFQSICVATSVFGNTMGLNPTAQVDGLLLPFGHDKDHRFPSKRYDKDDGKKQFEGAFVLAPRTVETSTGAAPWSKAQAAEWRNSHGMKNGILTNVHVCDFAGMYPNNIITWNLSEETKVVDATIIEACYAAYQAGLPLPEDVCRSPGTGLFTYTNRPGILPDALKEILRLRKFYSDEAAKYPPGTPQFVDAMAKSTAYKVLANTFYGVVGAPFSRYFDKNIAESTTQNGVWLIKAVMEQGERRTIEAVAGDTDSSFNIGPTREGFEAFVKWLNDKHLPKIIKATGVKESRVSLAFEKTFDILVYTAKKKYCNPPEAPILMADFTFKRLGDVRVGDKVVGWVDGTSEKKRHLVISEVGEVHKHVAPIVRLDMSSGRMIRCTPDHQWLRSRQLHTYREGAKNKKFKRRRVDNLEVLESGVQHYSYLWCKPKVGRKIVRIIDDPSRVLTRRQQREADWLGGIYDGEGSLTGVYRDHICFAQSRDVNPEVCARIESALELLGFRFSIYKIKVSNGGGECLRYDLLGGKQEAIRFMKWCRPAKAPRLYQAMFRTFFQHKPDEIISMVPDGEGEVIGLTTSTGNYIAWGYASKNCGRYGHYKHKTTCNKCITKKGDPGSVDVRTLICKDCEFQYTEQPVFLGKPEIKGLEYRKGDSTALARKLQGQIIDLLVGGLHLNPDHKDLQRPILDLDIYRDVITNMRRRILEEPLTREEVRTSKSLRKDLKSYTAKKKSDGEDGSLSAHVLVARILEQRGQSVGIGTKIEFVVVDGKASPMKVIPADDYNNDCDRHYLWDTLVYPPTQRLLEGAFPDVEWASLGDVRPPKRRGPTTKVSDKQLGLALTQGSEAMLTSDEYAITTFSPKPLSIRIPEAAGKKGIERLEKVLRANPGARSVEIVIVLKTGIEAVLASKLRVSTGTKLKNEIEKAISIP